MFSKYRLIKIIKKYNIITQKLFNTSIIINEKSSVFYKNYANFQKINKYTKKLLKLYELLKKSNLLLNEKKIEKELKILALLEKKDLENDILIYKNKLENFIYKNNIKDKETAILEIRSGIGGIESTLFCNILFKMYLKYINKKGWKIDIVSSIQTSVNGYKEIISIVYGIKAYYYLKNESGVHRVQRIPFTESNGRLHTSTVTVAVLPEIKKIKYNINNKDLKIESFKSTGAGGQHVNTTDSAVRITHIPTGISVVQTSKSQHHNKTNAIKILRSKIYNIEKNKLNLNRMKIRKKQIGQSERSEKIRTYNFPKDRITDHRINFTKYNLEKIMNEGNLDDFIKNLLNHQNTLKI